jgi:hypothetical protein
MFRRWALDWLRVDLNANTQIVEGREIAAQQEVQQRLTHWQNDPDLSSVRDPQGLAYGCPMRHRAFRYRGPGGPGDYSPGLPVG